GPLLLGLRGPLGRPHPVGGPHPRPAQALPRHEPADTSRPGDPALGQLARLSRRIVVRRTHRPRVARARLRHEGRIGQTRDVAQDPWAQSEYGVRFDWGAAGAARVGRREGVLVVVDVLSFTTAVTVAVERGVAVYPAAAHDERAVHLAREVGGVMA